MACGAGLFGKPGLALQSCLVNDKAQGRATVDDFAPFPLAHDPAGVLARDMGQGSQVILANPVSNEELARRPGGFSQMFCKLQQGACDACLKGKKARGRHLVIGLSHSLDENGDEVTVKPRKVTQTFGGMCCGPRRSIDCL